MNHLCGWIFERGEQWMASQSGFKTMDNALVMEPSSSTQLMLLELRRVHAMPMSTPGNMD